MLPFPQALPQIDMAGLGLQLIPQSSGLETPSGFETPSSQASSPTPSRSPINDSYPRLSTSPYPQPIEVDPPSAPSSSPSGGRPYLQPLEVDPPSAPSSSPSGGSPYLKPLEVDPPSSPGSNFPQSNPKPTPNSIPSRAPSYSPRPAFPTGSPSSPVPAGLGGSLALGAGVAALGAAAQIASGADPGRALGGAAASLAGQAAGGLAGAAIGSLVAPGVGTAIGSVVGQALGGILGGLGYNLWYPPDGETGQQPSQTGNPFNNFQPITLGQDQSGKRFDIYAEGPYVVTSTYTDGRPSATSNLRTSSALKGAVAPFTISAQDSSSGTRIYLRDSVGKGMDLGGYGASSSQSGSTTSTISLTPQFTPLDGGYPIPSPNLKPTAQPGATAFAPGNPTNVNGDPVPLRPVASPQGTPQATPQGTPQATPQGTPQATPSIPTVPLPLPFPLPNPVSNPPGFNPSPGGVPGITGAGVGGGGPQTTSGSGTTPVLQKLDGDGKLKIDPPPKQNLVPNPIPTTVPARNGDCPSPCPPCSPEDICEAECIADIQEKVGEILEKLNLDVTFPSNICEAECIVDIQDKATEILQRLATELITVPIIYGCNSDGTGKERAIQLDVPVNLAAVIRQEFEQLANIRRQACKTAYLSNRVYKILGGNSWFESPVAESPKRSDFFDKEFMDKAIKNIQFPEVTEQKTSSTSLLEWVQMCIARIYWRSGFNNLPANVPPTLLTYSEGDEPLKLQSLGEYIAWFIKQFDVLLGQFPINIEIEDTDLAEGGNQSKQIEIPNLAEGLAELFNLVSTSAINSDLSINFLTRLASEIMATKNAALISQDYAKANASFLGYDAKEVSRKIQYAFNPKNVEEQSGFDEFLQNGEGYIIGFQEEDKNSLITYLKNLMFSAAIIKAVFFRGEKQNKQLLEELKSLFEKSDNLNDAEWREWLRQLNLPESFFNQLNDEQSIPTSEVDNVPLTDPETGNKP